MINLNSENSIDWYKGDLGIFSIWHLNCYGVHIFLGCGDVDDNSNMIMLYELKTVKYKAKDGTEGIALSYDKKTGTFRAKDRRECLVAPRIKKNCCSNPSIKAYIKRNKKGEFYIPFEVDIGTELYEQIKKKGIYKEYMLPSLKMMFKFIGGRKKYKDIILTYWPEKGNKLENVMCIDEVVYEA